MKKLFAVLTLCCILTSSLACPVFATQAEIVETTAQIQYFDDGSYLVTEIETIRSARATNTVSAQKVIDYYSGNDDLLWSFYIYGTFTYNSGVSSTCIAASCESEILDSAWSCSEKTATPTGSSAFARGVFKKKFLFVTIDTQTVEAYLTCDKYGNIS